MNLIRFDTLESTNKYCELLNLSDVEEFSVIWALSQTAGIGQRGNCWSSAPGQNLTFSLILKPAFLEASCQFLLTKAVSLGIIDFLSGLLGNDARLAIKWPNDIYVDCSKICGILVSNRLHGTAISHSICGIGLNVNQRQFPDWVPNPTSLSQITGRSHPLKPLLLSLVRHIELRYLALQSNPAALDEDYLSRLLFLGQERTYLIHGQPLRATIQGVSKQGHLLLLQSGTLAPISCDLKEIQFCL